MTESLDESHKLQKGLIFWVCSFHEFIFFGSDFSWYLSFGYPKKCLGRASLSCTLNDVRVHSLGREVVFTQRPYGINPANWFRIGPKFGWYGKVSQKSGRFANVPFHCRVNRKGRFISGPGGDSVFKDGVVPQPIFFVT